MANLLDMSLDDIAKRNRSDRPNRSRSGVSKRPISHNHQGRNANSDKWRHDLFESDDRRRPARTQSDGVPPLANRIIISNLHYEVTEKDLESLFGQIGTIKRSKIKYDKSGRSLGIAEVTYFNPEDATQAKREFNGALAKGQNITIEYDPTSRPSTGSPAERVRLGSHRLRQTERSSRSGRSSRESHKNDDRSKQRRKPVTQQDLDKELDGYMQRGNASTDIDETTAIEQPTPEGDTMDIDTS